MDKVCLEPYTNTELCPDSHRNSFPLLEVDDRLLKKIKYEAVTSKFKKVIPLEQSCTLFCKGVKCKYCNPSGFGRRSGSRWGLQDMAIPGLYSNWITDNIIASSRPTSFAVEQFEIVNSFEKYNIKSLFNLQTCGEHSNCGFGILSNGLAYDPDIFMQNNIYYYNFPWLDHDADTPKNILEIVNVLRFALEQGKVLIHCHAGLGRTGVLIASYLILVRRKTMSEAIEFIRKNRPKAIQTLKQIWRLKMFERFVQPLLIVFSSVTTIVQNDYATDFTLSQFLRRQRFILHGTDARKMKHIPKVIYYIGQRVLSLTHIYHDIDSIATSEYTPEQEERLIAYKQSFNEGDDVYIKLANENDITLLMGLIWDWLDGLRDPILTAQDIPSMLKEAKLRQSGYISIYEKPFNGLKCLKNDTNGTIVFIFRVIANSLLGSCKVLSRTLSTLTHCQIYVENSECFKISQSNTLMTVNVCTMDEETSLMLFKFCNQLLLELHP